jgi:hypothetical protein
MAELFMYVLAFVIGLYLGNVLTRLAFDVEIKRLMDAKRKVRDCVEETRFF